MCFYKDYTRIPFQIIGNEVCKHIALIILKCYPGISDMFQGGLEKVSGLDDKSSISFVKFDVEQFYPSITKPLLSKAIQFAKSHTTISTQEEMILVHVRRNVLMDCDNKIWEKNSNPDFDVSTGRMDGADVSELVGIYLISRLMQKFDKSMFGIYRDDGIMVVKGEDQK